MLDLFDESVIDVLAQLANWSSTWKLESKMYIRSSR
jgi:hypothetical protein